MKPFWITYFLATTGLLAFCFSFLGNARMCGSLILGSILVTAWLLRNREALSRLRRKVPAAVLASVCGVALGFIIIFLIVGVLGSLIRR